RAAGTARMGRLRLQAGAPALGGPGARPAGLQQAQQRQHQQGQRAEGQEAPAVAAQLLHGQAQRAGHPPAGQPADLADPRAGQRKGTSWNRAPLPAPRAAKHTMNSVVVSTSDSAARPTSPIEAATTSSTTVSVCTPPQRSEIQPPAMRSAAPMKAASMVSWP